MSSKTAEDVGWIIWEALLGAIRDGKIATASAGSGRMTVVGRDDSTAIITITPGED